MGVKMDEKVILRYQWASLANRHPPVAHLVIQKHVTLINAH